MGLRIIPTLCSGEKKNVFDWRENQRLNVTFCIKKDPLVYTPVRLYPAPVLGDQSPLQCR